MNGIENGSRYFTDHFYEELMELYKKTHSIACAHFERKEGNGIRCDKQDIDTFRREAAGCSGCPIDVDEFIILKKLLKGNCDLEELRKECKDTLADQIVEALIDQVQEQNEISDDIREEILDTMKMYAVDHAETMNQYFKEIAEPLTLDSPFTRCFYKSENRCMHITYYFLDNAEYITETLMSNFDKELEELQMANYEKIQKLNKLKILTCKGLKFEESMQKVKSKYQENVLKLIAQLYAYLEWVHPWIDGQGRTDLILLNGLLCREGLNPCYLYCPYYSTLNPVDYWVNYLEDGVNLFKEIKEELESEKAI